MQRAIEEAGIPTIIIAALPPVVRQTGTPRAVAPLVPMGANAGGPHNVEQQTQIVKATLEQLEKIETPGKIVPLPFEYVAKIYFYLKNIVDLKKGRCILHLPFFKKRIRQYIGISCSILYTRVMEKA